MAKGIPFLSGFNLIHTFGLSLMQKICFRIYINMFFFLHFGSNNSTRDQQSVPKENDAATL